MPRPTTMRPTIKIAVEVAAAQARPPRPKIIAVTISKRRRPNRSAMRPPSKAPAAAPASTPLTMTSRAKVVSVKSFLRKSSAPEMTPVS